MATKDITKGPERPFALLVVKTLRIRTFVHEDDWRAACTQVADRHGRGSFEAMKYSHALGGYYKLEQAI